MGLLSPTMSMKFTIYVIYTQGVIKCQNGKYSYNVIGNAVTMMSNIGW